MLKLTEETKLEFIWIQFLIITELVNKLIKKHWNMPQLRIRVAKKNVELDTSMVQLKKLCGKIIINSKPLFVASITE